MAKTQKWFENVMHWSCPECGGRVRMKVHRSIFRHWRDCLPAFKEREDVSGENVPSVEVPGLWTPAGQPDPGA